MNDQASPSPALPVDSPAPPPIPAQNNFSTSSAPGETEATAEPKKWLSSGRSLLAFVWKFVVGMVLCQSFFGAILIVGWVYRASQRTVLKSWWKLSGLRDSGLSFQEFCAADPGTKEHLHWPNWIVAPNGEFLDKARQPISWSGTKAALKALIASLLLNAKRGVQGIFNTWTLTLPGCVMMLFSWYDGWNNSFNKGYENAIVGPAVGLSGIFLLIAAMFYVPMAQMRQASTGDWRSFYQFRLVWKLVKKRRIESIGLAMLYGFFSLPVMVLKVIPAFLPQINPALANVSAARALQISHTYYFWCAAVIFPAFLLLRIAAAKIYANALIGCFQSGAIPEDALGENEWRALHRLNLLKVNAPRPRHLLVRTVAWVGTGLGRVVSGFLLILIWFLFIGGQGYITEFIMKTEHGRGWLNQTLIQLPWFNFTPSKLENKELNI